MKKIGLILLMLWNTTFAFSCTCINMGHSTVKKALKYYDFVFTGRVISSETASLAPVDFNETIFEYMELFYQKKKYTFEVITIYKGKIQSDTIVVYSGFGTGDCGYKFLVDSTYIVYSNWNRSLTEADFRTLLKFIETDVCTRTRPLDSVEIKEIEKYSKRKKITSAKNNNSSSSHSFQEKKIIINTYEWYQQHLTETSTKGCVPLCTCFRSQTAIVRKTKR